MISLEQFRLAEGQKITYCSPVCACLVALEHPHSTPLALQTNSLVQAYLNQWGILLTAYEKLYNIHRHLMQQDDHEDNPQGLTAFDVAIVHMEDDIRIHAYVLMISMKSILDFFVCVVEATLTASVPDDNKLTDLSKFKKKRIKDSSYPLSFLADDEQFPVVNEVEQIRHKIVHRGYSIRTNLRFQKEADLPVLIYQGNNFYAEDGLIYPGALFANFINCICRWESDTADALPILQRNLQGQPKLMVSFTLDGGTTLFEVKEIEAADVP